MIGCRIALGVVWVPALAFCAFASAQLMERPELHEEDTWVYCLYEGGSLADPGNYESVESFTVVRVTPTYWGVSTGYQMARSLTSKRTGETKKSSYRISRDLNGYARQNPASPLQEVLWVQWPLEPGQSWRFERPLAAGTQIWETKINGWEDVEVPAGRFRTIRVDIDLVSNPNPLVTWQTKLWYSPDVKSFVKKTDYGFYEASAPIRRDTRELTSYTLH